MVGRTLISGPNYRQLLLPSHNYGDRREYGAKKFHRHSFFFFKKQFSFSKIITVTLFFFKKKSPSQFFFSKNYHHNGLKFRMTKTKKIKDRGSGSFLFCFCIIQQISTHLWTFTMSFILCCSLWFIGKWWTWSVFIWLMWPQATV